jgi:hypothetical protein
MDIVVERCCGLDVHKDTVVACVRTSGKGGKRQQDTRTFGTMTADLLALRDWLVAMGITLCGMESTGVYWKPAFYVLEDDVECWLLNARHLRNVPGKKTDVLDAEWICQLVEHGLVSPSFVPPKPIHELRDLTNTGRHRSKTAAAKHNSSTRCSKTPRSSCPPSPRTSSAVQGATCSRPWCRARATPRSSPNSYRASCAGRSPSSSAPSSAASARTTPSSSP